MSIGGPLNALYYIGHGPRSVRSEDLDGVNIGLLGNTVLGAGDSTGAVSSVSISILISIVGWDGLTPVGAALKVNVLSVGSGINDIDINTLTCISGI